MRLFFGAGLLGSCAAILGTWLVNKPDGLSALNSTSVPVPSSTAVPLADQPSSPQDLQERVAREVPGFGAGYTSTRPNRTG